MEEKYSLRTSFLHLHQLSYMDWHGIPTMAEELKKDNQVYNTISKELEKFYLQVLDLAWKQIDATEMKTVADQAKKADKKGENLF